MIEEITSHLINYLNETEYDNSILRGDLLESDIKKLLSNDLNAFMIGLISDQSVKFRTAWSLPYYLYKRLGVSNINEIYEKYDLNDIKRAIESKPALHRYPSNIAKYIYNYIKYMISNYNGDVYKFLDRDSALELYNELVSLDGISHKKASLGLLILERDLNYNFIDKENIDIADDVHIKRVLYRLGLSKDTKRDNIVDAARCIYPNYPGKLTTAVWTIGRNYCSNSNPKCSNCPMNNVCKKQI